MTILDAASLAERAVRVRVLAFDVDGVATDGRLFYGPVSAGASGDAAGASGEGAVGCAYPAFHARDGLGLAKAREAGLVLAAISGRTSKNVEARLSELKVPHIRQGVWKKAAELQSILDVVGCGFDEAAFVGDDVNDLSCLRRVGLAGAPRDAVPEVLDAVHWVSSRDGGHGVLRELVELVLRAQGKWSVDDEPLLPRPR